MFVFDFLDFGDGDLLFLLGVWYNMYVFLEFCLFIDCSVLFLFLFKFFFFVNIDNVVDGSWLGIYMFLVFIKLFVILW